MKLSYVIVTRNRRESLLSTLTRLAENTPLARNQWDVHIVDNASDDGTPDAVAGAAPWANVIRRESNEGMPARNHAFDVAKGQYIVLIDDDSYPVGDAIERAITYLDRNPKTAALVARVVLPDGSCEAPAMPTVLLGGASVIRKSVLDQVGGFDPEFFRQAEEYDLSFRIWNAGYAIERFEDLFFRHEKVATNRPSAVTRKMDLRNNLIVVGRYLPAELRRQLRKDYMRRYAALANADGHGDVIPAALTEARQILAQRRANRTILPSQIIDKLFHVEHVSRTIATWSQTLAVTRIVIGDYSKNLFLVFDACRRAGLEVLAIAEDAQAFAGSTYRGVPVVTMQQAANLNPDAAIMSNTNPAQIDTRLKAMRSALQVPVLRLWEPRYLMNEPGMQHNLRKSA